MTVLPSQKLSTGEFFVSLAAGLMLFLLPNDAKNQFSSEQICLSFIFLISFVITLVLFLVVKRYEAVGCALMSLAVLEILDLGYDTVNGIINKGGDYWPVFSEYDIISMFLLWAVPFLFTVCFRLLVIGSSDINEMRRGFARFMVLSMRSMVIIYALVLIFKLVIPEKPRIGEDRHIELMIMQRIRACLDGTHENGGEYLIWHCLIFAPFTFYLSVMVPKLRIWHIVIIALLLGLSVEALQFLLNTSTACTDDLIMYIVGAGLGMMIKRFIDFLRLIITDGEDVCMLSFDYTPKPSKKRSEPEILVDE